MLRIVLAFPLMLTAFAAEASCLSRGLGTSCYEPRGNSALSQPGRQLLPMPQADPRIAPSPSLQRQVPRARVQRPLGRPFPTVNGRVLRHPGLQPCVGASCNRQQRYFGTGCNSPRCM